MTDTVELAGMDGVDPLWLFPLLALADLERQPVPPTLVVDKARPIRGWRVMSSEPTGLQRLAYIDHRGRSAPATCELSTRIQVDSLRRSVLTAQARLGVAEHVAPHPLCACGHYLVPTLAAAREYAASAQAVGPFARVTGWGCVCTRAIYGDPPAALRVQYYRVHELLLPDALRSWAAPLRARHTTMPIHLANGRRPPAPITPPARGQHA